MEKVLYVMAHKGTLQLSDGNLVFEAEVDDRNGESGGCGYALLVPGSKAEKELIAHPAFSKMGMVWKASQEEADLVLGPLRRKVTAPASLSTGMATTETTEDKQVSAGTAAAAAK
jgi:hypothetical protein